MRIVFTMPGVVKYVREQIEKCRKNPREGLISELVQAEEDGDKLSEDELLSMVFLLLFAGFETTTHFITDNVMALEQNPEQKAFLFDKFSRANGTGDGGTRSLYDTGAKYEAPLRC